MEELAERIVEYSFINRKDLSEIPYILHIKRVRDKLKNKNEEIRVIALLHDLLEDCKEWNEDSLRCFFSKSIVDTVVILTKNKNEEYTDYIKRVSENGYATIVKIADLQDNMDVTRLKKLTDGGIKRLRKYIEAYQFLTN